MTLEVKAESHSVTTEAVAAQTYVTPVVHSAALRIVWQANRRVLDVQAGDSATLEEELVPASPACVELRQSAEQSDADLQASLRPLCSFWNAHSVIRYLENSKGLQVRQDSSDPLAPLGENAPPLLALWLRRAVRPAVIFPDQNFELGIKSQRSFRPSEQLLRDARGSETTEWLDAQSEAPSATLHVLQELSWNAPAALQSANAGRNMDSQPKEESFFSDSLTTLSLQDASLLRASRTASRSTSRHIAPVAGLPEPPDFSTKLTLVVTIERLP